MKVRHFDPQVNGYAGVDFSCVGLTLEAVNRAADLLEGKGTEKFLPTVITSSMEVYEQVLPVLAQAAGKDARIPGIHLEGPFISPEDGAVGAHPKAHVRVPSIEQFKKLQDLAEGHVRLLTLAPERPGVLELIEYLVENKVVVSVGHTFANPQQIQDACAAGATLATHLGNGIPNQLNRTDNPIWSVLASPLTVMLITDGFHLPPNFIKAAYAIKGTDKVILTSDAAPVAGLAPGEYDIFGTRVRLTEEGCVRNLNAPTLAGSAATLGQCADICRKVLGVGEKELNKMCWENILNVLK
ncbi:MAG: N-acetylglucosamine-6-phosphate deacetylase [Verrucomicrobia bacterium]|nr:N-acetylglucosamine-6-phosphate deacetylase [Verrucomicrobiota bacterium]